jgi:uncharacterized membrane protein YbhN (UPF0104 family)
LPDRQQYMPFTRAFPCATIPYENPCADSFHCPDRGAETFAGDTVITEELLANGEKKRTGIRKTAAIIIFMVVLGAVGVYVFRHMKEFHLISRVSVGAITLLSLLTVISTLCYAIQLKIVLDHYRLRLTLLDCFGISRATTFADLWLPFGGASSLKAVYLKKFHDLRYSSFIASMGIAQMMKIMLNGMAAVVLLTISGVQTGTLLSATVGAIFLGSLAFFLVVHKIDTRFFRISRHLKTLMEEWQKIRADRKTVQRLILLNLAFFFLNCFLIDAAFRSFETVIPFAASCLMASFTIITGVINLVPANLGIREAVIMASSAMFGTGLNEGLHAAALMRIVGTIWTLLLAPFFSAHLFNRTPR